MTSVRSFAGQTVNVTQAGERMWLVIFMHRRLGYFDHDTCPHREVRPDTHLRRIGSTR